MAKKKKKDEETKEVLVEYKVSMYCNACERTVAKAISKCKGVEKFTTDMNSHKVVVMGKFDPRKVLKKLKKKTGKRVEILAYKENEQHESNYGEEWVQGGVPRFLPDQPMFFDCCKDNELLMMFNDENPNACSIM